MVERVLRSICNHAEMELCSCKIQKNASQLLGSRKHQYRRDNRTDDFPSFSTQVLSGPVGLGKNET